MGVLFFPSSGDMQFARCGNLALRANSQYIRTFSNQIITRKEPVHTGLEFDAVQTAQRNSNYQSSSLSPLGNAGTVPRRTGNTFIAWFRPLRSTIAYFARAFTRFWSPTPALA